MEAYVAVDKGDTWEHMLIARPDKKKIKRNTFVSCVSLSVDHLEGKLDCAAIFNELILCKFYESSFIYCLFTLFWREGAKVRFLLGSNCKIKILSKLIE